VHLIEKEPVGKAIWIKSWPLGKDATYTHLPAEPRNVVVPLKSLIQIEAPTSEPPEMPVESISPVKEVKTMEISEEQLKTIIAGAVSAGIEDYRKSEPAVKSSPQVTVTLDEADRPFKSLGENLLAVVNATKYGQMHPRLRALKHIDAQLERIEAAEMKQLGMNEGIGSEGGFLVETDLQPGLLQEIHESGPFMPRVQKIQISGNANSTVLNGINEVSRVTGARWGGMVAYWLGEHGTKLPAMPSLKQLHLRLKKVAALAYATDEVLQDAAQLQTVIGDAAGGEIGFMVNDAIFRGTGGIDPQGILASPSLVTVAIEAAQLNTTFVFENALNMYARRMAGHRYAWFVNPNVMPELFSMNAAIGAGGQMVFLPPGGLNAAPYGTLFGLPIIENEFSPTLGALGDVSLLALDDYAFIEKGGIQAATSIHVAFLTDESCFRWVYRCDGVSKYASSITPYQSVLPIGPWIVLGGRP